MIGVGVKNSTSDLLIANCDEFIYYDDLVREEEAAAAQSGRAKAPAATASPRRKAAADEAKPPAKKGDEERRQEALDLIVETLEALIAERGDEEKIWGSMVKQALKRRKPGFNESYYGFRSFNGMLEEAAAARQPRARARREIRRLHRPAAGGRGVAARTWQEPHAPSASPQPAEIGPEAVTERGMKPRREA